jgi:iron(III) transport system substrate-binding protein
MVGGDLKWKAMRLIGGALIGVGLLVALAGCGGSKSSSARGETGYDDVFAAVQGLSGKERRDRLVELAAKEGGELTLYTSMGGDRVPELVDAFEDAFDIDVASYRANSETIVPRLLEEANAGFHGADVVRVQGLAMSNLNDEGILVDYDSPARKRLIEGTTFPGWTADSFSTFVVSWNTKLVPKDKAPMSWEALADPRWRGLVAIEAGDVNWYASLWNYWVNEQRKSKQDADRLFEAIAGNARVISGHTLLGQLMASGEVALGPNYRARVVELEKDHAPLAWEPAVEPVFPEPQGVGLVSGSEHPAAALLFVDWLLSDAQPLLVGFGQDAARKDLVAAPSVSRRVIDVTKIAAKEQTWANHYEQLLRLGKVLEK